MKRIYLLLAATAALFAGCETENPEITVESTLIGSDGQEITKTGLNENGKAIDWYAGDAIGVWSAHLGLTEYKSQNDANGANKERAVFKAGVAIDHSDTFYAVYPKPESVSGTKAKFTLGIDGGDGSYQQYFDGANYDSREQNHYDILYGSGTYDPTAGAVVIPFHHALSALKITVPALWCNDGSSSAYETSGYENFYEDYDMALNSITLDFYESDGSTPRNVCGDIEVDAVSGEVTASASRINVPTAGLQSGSGDIFWVFFAAPREAATMTVKLTMTGTLKRKDGAGEIPFSFTRDYTTGNPKQITADFKAGQFRTLNVSLKGYSFGGSTEQTIYSIDLGDIDYAKYGGNDAYKKHSGDNDEGNAYYYYNPLTSSGSIVTGMNDWYFYDVELKNKYSSGFFDGVKGVDRIQLQYQENGGFCTAPVVFPDNVTGVSITVKADVVDDYTIGHGWIKASNFTVGYIPQDTNMNSKFLGSMVKTSVNEVPTDKSTLSVSAQVPSFPNGARVAIMNDGYTNIFDTSGGRLVITNLSITMTSQYEYRF